MRGYIVRADPQPLHREENGKELRGRYDDWIVGDCERDCMMLNHISGFYRYTLFYDRITEYQSADLTYLPSIKQGRLKLKVQVIVIGDGLVTDEPIHSCCFHAASVQNSGLMSCPGVDAIQESDTTFASTGCWVLSG